MILKKLNDLWLRNYYKKYDDKLYFVIKHVRNEYYKNKIENNTTDIKQIW